MIFFVNNSPIIDPVKKHMTAFEGVYYVPRSDTHGNVSKTQRGKSRCL